MAEKPHPDPPTDEGRRDFLKSSLLLGAGLSAVGAGAWWMHDRRSNTGAVEGHVRDYRVEPDGQLPQLVSVHRDESPEQLTRAAIDAIGGMSRFVKPGEVVAVKPNIGWDRTPRHAANTDPELVATLVTMCFEANAAQVVVTDVTCNDANRTFKRSGIGQAAQEAGATVLLPRDDRMETMPINPPGSQGILSEWPVLAPLVDVDRFINCPVVKHHSLTGATLGIKNLYGLLGGQRNLLHQDIHQSLLDLARFIRPTLTVLDAVRVLVRNGPQGGSLSDVEQRNTVIASTDHVAADALGVTLLGRKPEEFPYLEMCAREGLGVMDLEQVAYRRIESGE